MTMTKEEVSSKLQQATKSNPVLSATFHMLALRERSRFNLTPDGLYYRMKKEGYDYNKADYLIVFKTLGELGLAKVVTDRRGRVEQLQDFRLPLRDLGALACGQRVALSKMGKLLSAHEAIKIEPIIVSSKPSAVSPPPPATVVPINHKAAERARMADLLPAKREARQPRPYQTPGTRLILTVLVNDKPINIPVPKDLTPQELSSFISNLMDKS